MKFIVAVDERWGIGRNGDLLMSIPEDMRFFRETTRGAVLVMGYNTLLSFPCSRPLPGRLNIVLADVGGLRVPGAVVCRTMDQLMGLIATFDSGDVYVIGGGMMYRQLMPFCDTAYITKMRYDGSADTFIPSLDELQCWSVADESQLKNYEGIDYSFVTYHNSSVENISFRSESSDMSAYFMKKQDIPDGAELSNSLVQAYMKPLRDGFSSEDVERFLSSGEGSFEKYLRDKKLIASPDDISGLL